MAMLPTRMHLMLATCLMLLVSEARAHQAGQKKIDNDDPLPNGALARLGTSRFRGWEGPSRVRPVLSRQADIFALIDVEGKSSILDVATGAPVPQFAFLRKPRPKLGGDWT